MKTSKVNAQQVLGQYLKTHQLDAAAVAKNPALIETVAANTKLPPATVAQLASQFSSAPPADTRKLTGESGTAATPAGGGVYAESQTAARQTLAREATKAAVEAHAADPSKVTHVMVEKLGEEVGHSLGVLVTEALKVVPSANAPLLDASGKPVESIPGATRIGDHDILTRHQEIIGPKITAFVQKLSPGVVHDLLEGMGIGATQAPGDTYRQEVAEADRKKA
jgi:hypothetical protein